MLISPYKLTGLIFTMSTIMTLSAVHARLIVWLACFIMLITAWILLLYQESLDKMYRSIRSSTFRMMGHSKENSKTQKTKKIISPPLILGFNYMIVWVALSLITDVRWNVWILIGVWILCIFLHFFLKPKSLEKQNENQKS